MTDPYFPTFDDGVPVGQLDDVAPENARYRVTWRTLSGRTGERLFVRHRDALAFVHVVDRLDRLPRSRAVLERLDNGGRP